MNLHLDILEVNFYYMKLLLEDELRLLRPSLPSIKKKIEKVKKEFPPDVGFEPTTFRSIARCSTD